MANILALEAAVNEHLLLFDTTLLIHEYTRQTNLLGRIPRPQRLTSPVAVWEFVHLQDGQLIAHAERLERRDWMDRQEIRSAWVSPGAQHAFQTLLWHAHHTAGVVDCLLAAESISRGWPLVTRNLRHFEDIPGMLVVPY